MSLFSKLFGGGSAAQPEPEPTLYEGFRILPDPIKEGGGYRLAATIEKEVGGAVKTHRLVRADVFRDADEAKAFSLAKAKLLIDQMGEGLFG